MGLFEENLGLFDETIEEILKWHKKHYTEWGNVDPENGKTPTNPRALTDTKTLSDGLMKTSKQVVKSKALYEETKDRSKEKLEFLDGAINNILKWHKDNYSTRKSELGYETSRSLMNALEELVEAKDYYLKGK